MSTNICPCHSGASYNECCQPYHQGLRAINAITLMRSRYSAYAMGLVDYIIKTTHPEYPDFKNKPLTQWKKELNYFSQETSFDGLEIIDFSEDGNEATVTFKAILSSDGQDLTFTEKSSFEKIEDHWLYKSGEPIK